jgi:hypothetical protein
VYATARVTRHSSKLQQTQTQQQQQQQAASSNLQQQQQQQQQEHSSDARSAHDNSSQWVLFADAAGVK